MHMVGIISTKSNITCNGIQHIDVADEPSVDFEIHI